MRVPGVIVKTLVAMALVLASTAAQAADPPKPVAILSVASIDRLMGDFGYLARLGGRPEVGGMMALAGGAFVQDLDRTKPLGLLITIENDEPKGVAFLPVPNLDKVLKLLRDRFNANTDDLGNGIKKLELGKGAFLKQQGEWLFVSDQPQHLAHLPADPVAMLDGLDKQYSVALRFYVQNVPQNLRDLATFQLHSQIDADARDLKLDDPDIDGPFFASNRQQLKQAINILFNQSDQLTLGWVVDSQGGRTYADLQATAVPGSPLAQWWSGFSENRSDLMGFVVDDGAATLQGAVHFSPERGERLRAVVDYLRHKALQGIQRDPNAPAAITDVVNGVLDIIDRTVQEGKSEIAASVVLGPKSFQFIAGLHVADGRALAAAFQKLYELAKQQPDVPEVKFFAEKHGDVDFHTLTIPIAERDADARRTLGEKLDVVVGTGPQSLYVALGEQGDQLLKAAIDKSAAMGEQPVPPIHIRVAAKPLVAFLASVAGADEKPAKMAEILSQSRGGDSILLTISPLDNGIGCRLQVDEAVLEVLGKTAQSSAKPR
jgi:hypothetical protein